MAAIFFRPHGVHNSNGKVHRVNVVFTDVQGDPGASHTHPMNPTIWGPFLLKWINLNPSMDT